MCLILRKGLFQPCLIGATTHRCRGEHRRHTSVHCLPFSHTIAEFTAGVGQLDASLGWVWAEGRWVEVSPSGEGQSQETTSSLFPSPQAQTLMSDMPMTWLFPWAKNCEGNDRGRWGSEMTGGADLPPATSPGLLFETENNLFLSHSFLGVFLVQQLNHYPNIRANSRDCPGGPVVKKPPSNVGNMGLIPGWGTKIPQALGQLSLHVTTTESTNHK